MNYAAETVRQRKSIIDSSIRPTVRAIIVMDLISEQPLSLDPGDQPMTDTSSIKTKKAEPKAPAAAPSTKPTAKAQASQADISAPATKKAPAATKPVRSTPKATAASPQSGVQAKPAKTSAATKAAKPTTADTVPAVAKPAAATTRKKPGKESSSLPDQQEIDRMIAEAAYYLAEKRNFASGWEQQDWETAKREVMARLQQGKS